MPTWLFPTLTSGFLAILTGLIAWIGKSFDRRLGEFEKIFDERMSKLELILDRGERHEAAIAKIQDEVSNLRVDLARWGGN